jgi:perosamine synthetase
MTCSMTNHPILEQFAEPVFADIQPDTGNIDPQDLEKRITPRTKAILCSHWGGYPCDLEELNHIGMAHGLPIIEDASEAFGATYRGRPIGSISRFAAFSFQAIQIITTGEGGMLVALASADAAKARRKRWYGIDREGRQLNLLGYYDFDVTEKGYGYHLTNIAATIGLANLASLSSQQKRRQHIASRYREELSDQPGITMLRIDDDRSSSNHFFTMHVERREEFCRMMIHHGIQVSIVHHRNDVYKIFGGKRPDLPQLDYFCETYIGLPIHTGLSDEDIDSIIRRVHLGW